MGEGIGIGIVLGIVIVVVLVQLIQLARRGETSIGGRSEKKSDTVWRTIGEILGWFSRW